MTFIFFYFLTFLPNFYFILSAQVGFKNENATFQNIDFVEIVKEDLRRNNEDYGEIRNGNKFTSASKGISKKNTITLNAKNNRRTNVDSTEYSYDDKVNSTTKELISNNSTTANPIKELLRSQTKKKIKISNQKEKVKEMFGKRLNKIDIKKTVTFLTTKPDNATRSLQMKDEKIPKFVNKNKIDKFKKFMSKNKILFKDFMSSKMEIQTQKNKPLRQNDVFNMLKPANIVRSRQKSEEDTLNPDMLDMAPAKGGRIHRQRLKGRLCQRHVLMPEGPKYDSLGKWYLPAHNLVVSRPYNVTRRPKLLLPRCCNCCKKSVLGCE